jgi:hypothetical protein
MVLGSVPSQDQVSLLRAVWKLVAPNERAALIGEAISGGDAVFRQRAWLIRVIRNLRGRGQRILDGDEAAEKLAGLPDQVNVFRGAAMAEVESARLGLSWCLDAERARWFATSHGRFRNTRSPPCVIGAWVERELIAGVLCARGEDEVLLLPGSYFVQAVHSETTGWLFHNP